MSGWSKFVLFVGGVLLPVACFGMAFTRPFGASWQSGTFGAKAGYLLQPPAVGPLLPFFVLLMASFAAALFSSKLSTSALVRTGLALGALTSVVYAVVLISEIKKHHPVGTIAVNAIAYLMITVAAGAFLWAIGGSLISAFGALVVGMVHGVLLLFLVILVDPIVWFFALGLGPGWAAGAYTTLFIRSTLMEPGRHPVSLSQWIGCISIIAAYAVAWRWAIHAALREYSKLPVKPPEDCFVATAASRGRPGQLRRLKAAEIALMTLAPRAHASLRRVYDRVGPRWARAIRSDSSAAAARLALMPLEWTAWTALRILAGSPDASLSPTAKTPTAAARCSDPAAPPRPACLS